MTDLEKTESAEKATNKPKSAPLQGHRKKIFSREQAIMIAYFYVCDPEISKRELARLFSCDEKTIRNIIKKYGDVAAKWL